MIDGRCKEGPPTSRPARAGSMMRSMRVQELKALVQAADYTVDAGAVAEAILWRALAYQRCSNPPASWRPDASQSTTPGGPSKTRPTQVIPAAASAAPHSPDPTQTHSS